MRGQKELGLGEVSPVEDLTDTTLTATIPHWILSKISLRHPHPHPTLKH